MMRGLKITALLLVLSLLLGGCSLFVAEESQGEQVCIPKAKLDNLGLTVDQLMEKLDNMTGDVNVTENESEDMNVSEPSQNETGEEDDSEPSQDEMPVRTFTAGELVEVNPQSESNDLTYVFSEPLNDEGQWQTTAEDAGEYVVNVTATNSAGSSIKKQVRVVVEEANEPPVLSGLDDVTVNAGETIELTPEVSDPEGDEVSISYSGWMTSPTKETTEEDVGQHTVTVTASDGTSETSEEVTVTVQEVNNPPQIAELGQVTVTEGDMVSVEPQVTDEDGDEVTLSYSEPLDENGEWQTQDGDAGTYSVTVTASDGDLEASESFSIVVEQANAAPQIEQQDVQVNVTEGESKTLELNPEVSDPDGNEVEVSYSGWMNSSTKTVTEEDEGEHTVTITATDGEAETSVDITVQVNVNTPPEFTL